MDMEFLEKQYAKSCLHQELLNEIITAKLTDGKVTTERLTLFAELLNDAMSSKAYYEREIAKAKREENKQ